MTEHLATVTLCGVLYDVVAQAVSSTLLTWPAWLLVALGWLTAAGVCLTVLAVGAVLLFSLELYWAVKDERKRL